jgi:hypothetical protein
VRMSDQLDRNIAIRLTIFPQQVWHDKHEPLAQKLERFGFGYQTFQIAFGRPDLRLVDPFRSDNDNPHSGARDIWNLHTALVGSGGGSDISSSHPS